MSDEKITGRIVCCPFFRKETPTALGCEGLTAESFLRLSFATREAKDQWAKVYCEGFGYKCCPLARMLEEKYEE